jgi:hypothetical protein
VVIDCVISVYLGEKRGSDFCNWCFAFILDQFINFICAQ